MSQYLDRLLKREAQFAAFATGPLLDFWRQREEGEFIGVDNVPIRFVRFTSAAHQQLVVIFSGRTESYIKYNEVAYDLFQCGYDVMMMDHRGQGRSGRLLKDRHRGHVLRFGDYVDDVATFWQQQIASGRYVRRFALSHSMGGTILSQFLARQPQAFDAAVLCAPMCGIHLPVPHWLAWRFLNWGERHPAVRDYYAIGTRQWQALPFLVNILTHSYERYQRSVRFYADDPDLRVGGPTYHWVREALMAGEQLLSQAVDITTPLLLLQAEEDRVVDNHSQDVFCQALAEAGHPSAGSAPRVINGARHEILFEKDTMRAEAFRLIFEYFEYYR
ncbi:lysophospholipase [Prodigiosinella confusarubida]|uniref:Lysophospholipase n=1 Tax=Serratia sp. (strain ATCC 39006) TaxID=104623 RepID=A0A2I5T3E2_SERS3|nr:lysophospholipase L2 [Serratia sp. ATCC 39006]AUG99079.1 lysophospholipase [Serratia sp. ATCC 39006]AUH03395.1 lysophospholipase [Serratia sp. ATCC 39006]